MVKSFFSILILTLSFSVVFSQTPNPEVTKDEKPGFFSVWWGNFVSYFNVYYNATRLYDRTIQLFYEDNLKNGNEISTVFPVFKKGSTGRADLQKVSNKAITIIQNHPESDLADNALLLVGKAYYYMGDLAPAERKFREVISNYDHPDVVFEATLFLARAFLEQNKNEEALSLVQDLIKRDDVPDQVKGEANLMLGERYFLEGQIETAIPLFIQGIELYDDQEADARASYLIAKALMKKQQFEEAITFFAGARKSSSLPAVWYWSGVRTLECMIQTGKIDEAQDYLSVMQDDDDLAGFFGPLKIEQARIYKAKKENDEAILAYQEFILDNPSSQVIASGWYELGELILSEQKDLELSRYYFEKASQASVPDTVVAKAKLKETELKTYLELSYEIIDLKNLIYLGIIKQKPVIADSLIKQKTDSLKSQESDSLQFIASDSTAVPLPAAGTELAVDFPQEQTQPSGFPVFPQMQPMQTPQFNTPGEGDNQFPQTENQFPQNDSMFPPTESDFGGIPPPSQNSQASMTRPSAGQSAVKVNPFSEEVISKTYLNLKYKSKYNQAVDSNSFRKLRESYEMLSEKKVEHFYFTSQQMDSVILFSDQFVAQFPESKRIPRILYAKSAALTEKNQIGESDLQLKTLAMQYPTSPYGVEAKKRLGIPDSLGILQLSVEASFLNVIKWIEKGSLDSAKQSINSLLKTDSTFSVYPRILYAKGYVSEKLDRNWPEAFKWYSKIVTSFPAHPISKALITQIDFGTASGGTKPVGTKPAAKEESAAPDVAVAGEVPAGPGTPTIKGKREEMKFVITPNLPQRFKRQPKISLTW
ncbi:MAG: tetratricopeptide repeat protein [Bacteroidetes bacterium]|nr:tetratricopeptide repeat protein [Bacteroidota bacterium]